MNLTPRLRSAYPSTPRSETKGYRQGSLQDETQGASSPRPDASAPTADVFTPMIPFNIVDAPSQRFYATLLYVVIILWRLYDYVNLISDDTDGFWLFTKWVGIDTTFLYGLSALNIPWLQWSSSTFTVLFIAHGALNWILMFRIPIPLLSWLGAFTKILYDREYAVSEHKVRPASILQNSSLILGKQIIHILPEGSAMLNPDQIPICIGDSRMPGDLPIHINQTDPILIEIFRVDLDTNTNETITLTTKEIKKLRKYADRTHTKTDVARPRIIHYPVKQTGLYRLQRVIDDSHLEVRIRPSEVIVVSCPSALIRSVSQHRCKGDLSDFYLQVDATPPLKVRYSKTVKREDQGHTVLSIHPENLPSPLNRQRNQGVLISQASSASIDISWARTQSLQIPLNESLGVSGGWQYVIDEVHDALGNTANYSDPRESESSHHKGLKDHTLEQHFSVHERPSVSLYGCDAQNPIKVEKGRSKILPIRLGSTKTKLGDTRFTLSYIFTPQHEILPDQQHAESATSHSTVLEDANYGLEVHEPGLYTLSSISSSFCGGEILEPSSCLLMNPPEPDLAISADSIPDKCAGSSIGLTVDLDLLGTPPFRVYYIIRQPGGDIKPVMVDVQRFHTQIELKPPHAGQYTYEFERISDAVYSEPRSLAHKNLVLQQDVRPPASARILDAEPTRKACIGEPVTFYIQTLGEPPYSVDYELVHRGKRRKRTIDDIQEKFYSLTTEPLTDGGEYALALTSIRDKTGCKTALDAEAKVDVGLQRPKASFGYLEGKRSILALEDRKINLPLRLQGEAPWRLTYRNLDDPTEELIQKTLQTRNDKIEVTAQGTYEIIEIHDVTCPGSVEPSAHRFSVQWVPRPALRLTQSPLIEQTREKYVKKDVCEGDEDSTEIALSGTAPFNIEYEQRHKPGHGSESISTKKFTAGLPTASFRMETAEAGIYEYRFSKLGDMSYNYDPQKFLPLTVQQWVHPRPSASFADNGKTYKYCQDEEEGDEVVPILLRGQPPFHLELEIRHHATAKPQVINVPYVESNRHNMHIPHRVLALGTHTVIIRKVGDSRGCQRNMDFNAPHVQISVADIPSISSLEEQTEHCAGDRISFALSGTPPFNVFYTFQDHQRKANVPNTEFRRIAEKPGLFVITAVSDQRSTDACKAKTEIKKIIHEMPSVRVSKGRTATVDIHEGGEAEILFEFGGTPPFHFTYTRSTTPSKGGKSEVLETKNEISSEYSKTIWASDEGMYEVVSIRDKFCAFSSHKAQGKSGQKLLTSR